MSYVNGNNPVERKELMMQEKEMTIPRALFEKVTVGGIYCVRERICLC